MKKFIYSTLTLALLASCQSINKESYNIDSDASPKGTEVFHPDWKNIADNYQFPEWFADAKFGIFIHKKTNTKTTKKTKKKTNKKKQ